VEASFPFTSQLLVLVWISILPFLLWVQAFGILRAFPFLRNLSLILQASHVRSGYDESKRSIFLANLAGSFECYCRMQRFLGGGVFYFSSLWTWIFGSYLSLSSHFERVILSCSLARFWMSKFLSLMMILSSVAILKPKKNVWSCFGEVFQMPGFWIGSYESLVLAQG